MTQKNKAFLGLSAVLGVALVFIMFSRQSNNLAEKVDASNSTLSEGNGVAVDSARPKNTFSNRVLEESFQPPEPLDAQVKDGYIEDPLWVTKGKDFRRAPPKWKHLDNAGVDRAFIEVARKTIEAIGAGVTFDVAIPQTGARYPTKVEDIIFHPNGDKTIKGKIQGFGSELYSVTITQGEMGTFATMSTPDGVYVLEGDVRDGWIAAKDELARQHNREESDAVYFKPLKGEEPKG